MELHKLTIDVREDANGKGAARQLRRSGQIPVVLYGGNKEPVSVQVEEKEFIHLIHGRGGEHAIVQLECGADPGLNSPAILKEVQHHPIRGDVLHADFMRIRLDERLQTLVPIVLTGQAKGVVEGGVLDHQLREVEVECLALDVPEQIELAVDDVGIGEGLHVSDLQVSDNVTILTESDRSVMAILAPRVVEEEAPEGEEVEGVVEGEEAPAAEGADEGDSSKDAE